jgi:hypothetical protein
LVLALEAEQLAFGQQTHLTVTLRDGSGRPVVGALITLFGSLGTVSPSSAVSDDQGQVRGVFAAGRVPGQATLTALAGYASAAADVRITLPLLQHHVILPILLK